ncbi:small ribosomal subunit Rsm22 family protein [Occallatibacter savannae]|uniref:small ribosomal subunit Rsm22 family protein n=1 Tax=Occallatibacter savannae TaxID=1002691 RepID=UPI0019514E96|nr:small ribosomal subunit Rsm22 family protein [Occallatibacter savannae]
MQLPPELRNAIARQLEGVSRNLLSERAARISAHYRNGGGSAHALRDDLDALAYAVARMPATYAAVRNVLARFPERLPALSPVTILDLGAGPGTASWAAADAWPAISSITQLDSNALLLDLGRKLSASAMSGPLREARVVQTSLPTPLPHSADLILLSYTLAEMAAPDIRALLTSAWTSCAGALAIIEPGTPAGYERILLARNLLIEQGAKILAPCPHHQPCPLVAPDWCHFAQRVQRSRDHMLLKSADVPWEDEKFSYLIAVRDSLFTPAANARILAQPQITKAGITAKLCRLDGHAEFVQIPKRDPAAFKAMKKKDWGDEA